MELWVQNFTLTNILIHLKLYIIPVQSSSKTEKLLVTRQEEALSCWK